jgi:hypothetical protein
MLFPARFNDSRGDDLKSEFSSNFGVADVDHFQLDQFPIDFRRV